MWSFLMFLLFFILQILLRVNVRKHLWFRPNYCFRDFSAGDLVCWDDILAKHHPRFTHCMTHFAALLNKLSMAISKHLHNTLKIDPASEFTCCSILSKPHTHLRPHEMLQFSENSNTASPPTLSMSVQWSTGQNMAWRDRRTEENAVCHYCLDQLS